MKKVTKRTTTREGSRLTLHRETLRGLDDSALDLIAGGVTYYCHSGGTHSACSNC